MAVLDSTVCIRFANLNRCCETIELARETVSLMNPETVQLFTLIAMKLRLGSIIRLFNKCITFYVDKSHICVQKSEWENFMWQNVMILLTLYHQ